jgi:hypothetical protein
LKKLLIASLAAGVLAVAAPAAQATHDSGPGLNNYFGGCSFLTLNDTTPGGQLGGQDVWNGEIDGEFIANDNGTTTAGAQAVPTPTVNISATCELKVNGVSQGTVAVCNQPGVGVAVCGSTIQFTAAVTDIVSLCDHVHVGADFYTNCGDATTTQIVPQPVIDALNAVIDLLNSAVFSQLDPAICLVLTTLAPIVNNLPPDVIHIDPVTGDTSILGEPFWDCPPYV